VTDVTGHTDKAVLAELAEQSVPVRVLLPEGLDVPMRSANIEVVRGDPANDADLRRAMEGIEAVLVASTYSPNLAETHLRAATAAKAAGVRRLVQVTGVGADAGMCCARALRWLGQAEERVATAGIDVTRVRPTFLMQTLFEFTASIAQQGVIAGPFRVNPWTWVDARDVAAVAIAALKDPVHAGQTYTVTGERLSFCDITQLMSRVLDKPVRYTDITANEARGWLQAKGVPPVMIEAKLELWDAYASNWINMAPNDTVRNVTGHEPRSMESFLREFKARFLSASAA
jgi:uncharacterized protein YbjT (DUF2867 family)